MEQKYVVRFAKSDPETPPTMDEQIALARRAAQKLGVPKFGSAAQQIEPCLIGEGVERP